MKEARGPRKHKAKGTTAKEKDKNVLMKRWLKVRGKKYTQKGKDCLALFSGVFKGRAGWWWDLKLVAREGSYKESPKSISH